MEITGQQNFRFAAFGTFPKFAAMPGNCRVPVRPGASMLRRNAIFPEINSSSRNKIDAACALYLSAAFARPRERISRRICHVEAWRNDRCRESVAVSDVTNVHTSGDGSHRCGMSNVGEKEKKKEICRTYFRTFDHRSWYEYLLEFLAQLLIDRLILFARWMAEFIAFV